MGNHSDIIQAGIMRDMREGVMTIGLDGIISYVNPAAEKILSKTSEELLNQRFAACFFEYEQNDAFNQTILDAVYDATVSHRNVVPYYTGEQIRQLHVTTSYLKSGEEKIGVIAVLGDISELSELRDAVKAMEQIRELNGQLSLRNKLLSETFGRFLSDEIVRQLLETPDGLALGGKKRVVTILMSDLRGFTAMSERMHPQDLISMLNHYLGQMTEIIQKRNGTIIEFIGDGILAVFGAPLESECHASDAVAAAIEMQMCMQSVNTWNKERGYPVLKMGIGINTGDVIVGNIGSEKRTKYGVVGQHVNLCGRIESYTVGGQVLIPPKTRELIGESLVIEEELQVTPKGVHEPILLSYVTGIGGAYQLFAAQKQEEMRRLESPKEVVFFQIYEKHRDMHRKRGRLTALSETGAVLETDEALQQFDNLEILAGGRLICKVVERMDHAWKICFTAIPDRFAEWCRDMR